MRRLLADYALEHTGLKFLSLLLALSLWFLISNQASSVTTLRNVPVEFQNIREGLQVRNAERDSINVRIRGTRDALADLRAGIPRVSVVADLKTFQSGKRIISLTPDDVVKPPNIEVLSIEPSRFGITLERVGKSSVPVEPAIEGTPSAGYELAGVDVSPASIAVSGPESVLRRVKRVSTETISIAGKTEDFTVAADVDSPDPALQIVENAEVSVRIRIVRSQQAIEFASVPVTVIPHPERASVDPSRVKVMLTGHKSELAQIRPTQLLVIANVTGLGSGQHVLSAIVRMPDSIRSKISSAKITPEKVTVTLR